MSLEQAAKAFPKISIPAADPYGVTQLRVIGKDLNGAALKSNFEGVTFASFSFLDKRLVSIHFSYDSKRSSWANLNEFITNVAASLNLPTGWRGSPDPSVEIQHLDCDGFTVSAGFVFDNESFIRLTDETAKEIVKKREEEERERKRGAEKEKIFKP